MTNLSLSLAFGLGSVQALIIYWCNASACSCEIRAFSQSATCAHVNKPRVEQAISQNIDINHPLRREFLHKNRCREMETSLSRRRGAIKLLLFTVYLSWHCWASVCQYWDFFGTSSSHRSRSDEFYDNLPFYFFVSFANCAELVVMQFRIRKKSDDLQIPARQKSFHHDSS